MACTDVLTTDAAGPDSSAERLTTLLDLQPDLFRRVASYVHCNEVAGSLKLTCKAAALYLADSRTISCREGPVPAHALVWKWSQLEAVSGLTHQERGTVARRTIETGSLDAVRRLVTGEGSLEDVGTLGHALTSTMFVAAAGAGQLAVAQHLRRRGCPWDFSAGCVAAGKGHREVCLWLLAEGCPDDLLMHNAAARGGHADTCEQLLAAGCPWSAEAAGEAADGGHVSLMRRLLQLSEEQPEQRPLDVIRLMCGAAEGLDLATLQLLHEQYMPRIPSVRAAAVGASVLQRAAWGHTADYQEKVDWLLSLGYRPGEEELLSPVWPLRLCRGPSASGPALVARLCFMQQRGFRLGVDAALYLLTGTCDEPAALAFMLDEAGLQPDDDTAMYIASSACCDASLRSLRLLHQRGWLTPVRMYSYQLLLQAVKNGQLRAATWVFETLGGGWMEPVIPGHIERLVGACARGDRLAVASWLIDNVCGNGPGKHPYTAELFAAAAQLGSVPLLQQLRERHCPWDATAWQGAVRSGCEAVLQWLHDEGCPRPVSSTERTAACTLVMPGPCFDVVVLASAPLTPAWQWA
jgi:hypothetical protein